MQVKSRLVVVLCSILCYLAYVVMGLLVIKLFPDSSLFIREVAVNHVWLFFFTIPSFVIYASYKGGKYRNSNLIVDIVCVLLIFLAIVSLYRYFTTDMNFKDFKDFWKPSSADDMRSKISVLLLFVVHGIVMKGVLNSRWLSGMTSLHKLQFRS